MKLSKSKLALSKVINENGGWPERALWAVQDNCIAFFLGGKPEYKSGDRCWYSNSIDGACVGTITRDEKVTNWHQTVLSREEYYQAYQKADADGWIEWKGGECPVGKNVTGDIKLACGEKFDTTDMAMWNWHLGNGNPRSIIAYRPHKPEVKPELCESVMRSIPEPESKPTIEQLAQDYRNAKDYADRKQQEADDAKAAADAALGELERAGEALGLVVTQVREDRTPNPIIADFRYLKIGDAVRIVRDNIGGRYNGYEGHVAMIDPDDTRTPVLVNLSFGTMWCHEVEFIR
ncbi:hypothetical protein phiA005_0038 [Aeromonas phage phiA005]|nr:hypothetical protein phiA005_0038 [Aeromonas phage phiA005]